MATLQVELVAVERKIWSGEATMVIARTTEGELGVLPGHAPLLGQLAEGGVVTIRTESGDDVIVAAHGGFLSVTDRNPPCAATMTSSPESVRMVTTPPSAS